MSDVVATRNLVEAAVSAAMAQVLPAELAGGDPLVRRGEHADFQSNVALAVAKRAQRSPRDLSLALTEALDSRAVSATVSGPGFLNLTVPGPAIWERVDQRLAADRLGVAAPLAGTRVVVDYSALNIAREMHVGHLRSTVIGDALVRVLGFLGADVALAKAFNDFYEECPVLRAETDALRDNRTALCRLTGRTLATGLDLLGIEAPARL